MTWESESQVRFRVRFGGHEEEIVAGNREEAIRAVRAFAGRMGLRAFEVKDSEGRIINPSEFDPQDGDLFIIEDKNAAA